MILCHPYCRVSPVLFRWPLLAADVPRASWTLSDEVVAVMERQRRQMIKGRSKSDQEEMCVENVDAEIALPTITTCQHALNGLLQSLSQASNAHSTRKTRNSTQREAIINWRDVLSILSSRPLVPQAVFNATQERLEAIYGDVQYTPPPSWIPTLGLGGLDRIYETLKAEDPTPTHWHRHRRTTPPQNPHQELRALDEELLLPKTKKRSRYLEPAPVQRHVRKRSVPTGD
jgi:hypothetical protein